MLRFAFISLILFPLTVSLLYPIACRLPFGWNSGARLIVPTQHPGKYSGTADFHIVAYGTGRGKRLHLTWADVRYDGISDIYEMRVDLDAMTYRILYNEEHSETRPLTREIVLDYISHCSFDPVAAESSLVADEIWGKLRGLSTGVLPPELSEGFPESKLPPNTYVMQGTNLISLSEFGHLVWLPWYWPLCFLVSLLASALIARSTLPREKQAS